MRYCMVKRRLYWVTGLILVMTAIWKHNDSRKSQSGACHSNARAVRNCQQNTYRAQSHAGLTTRKGGTSVSYCQTTIWLYQSPLPGIVQECTTTLSVVCVG